MTREEKVEIAKKLFSPLFWEFEEDEKSYRFVAKYPYAQEYASGVAFLSMNAVTPFLVTKDGKVAIEIIKL